MINYVNTGPGDNLSYPYVLRVTFGETPSVLVPNALASMQLSADIDNLASSMQGVAGVAIASDPTVPPDALAVTIDFAPLDPTASVSVATALSQMQNALTGPLEFISNTTIVRVEKIDSRQSTGDGGAAARGADTQTVTQALQTSSFGDQLTIFLSKTENLLLVAVGVGALFYFGPEIKLALRGLTRKRT